MKRLFALPDAVYSWKKELLAGATTFSAMAYIIVINPSILAEGGFPFSSVLVTTCIISAISTFFMGLMSKLPFAIGPGMGVSSFAAFAIMAKHGTSFSEILTATLLVGVLLLLLNALKLREKLITMIPDSLLHGAIGGIGAFLIFVGLKEIGLLSLSTHHFIGFGTFSLEKVLLVVASLILILLLMHFEVSSAFLLGILLIWACSLALGHSTWQGFINLPPSIKPTFLQFQGHFLLHQSFWKITFSLFLVTLFDSTASLFTLLRMVKRNPKNMQPLLYPDAIGTTLGACLGTTSMAIHLESASGIHSGGKTGFSSLVVALLFLLSLFLYPLVSSIPSFASAPILFIIGMHMLETIKGVNFKRISEWIPAISMILAMPLLFSIYLGFAIGFFSYTVLKVVTGQIREISLLTWIITALFLIQMTI